MSHFIDCHTHAHFAAFKEDWKEVIERALKNDVWVVNVGTQKNTSQKAVDVAHSFPEGVFATVGLHPVHTSKSFHDAQEIDSSDGKGFTSREEEFDRGFYKNLALDPKTVGIGECGLDYYHPAGTPDIDPEWKNRQKKAFEAQIELSKEVRKPLMIHSREAIPETIDMLRSAGASEGIAHACVRTIEEAKGFLDMGFYFTFAGNITFKPKPDKPSMDEVVRFLPMDRILSETDAPYMSPVPYRGKRNEPLYVAEVVKKLAQIKGIPAEEMKENIWRNAKRAFRLD